jgi:PAS domain S-box-containing protein
VSFRLLLVLLCILFISDIVNAKEKIVFGIFENRTRDIDVNKYNVLEDYLNSKIDNKECRIDIEMMTYDAINSAVRNKKVQFIMVSPLQYMELKNQNLISSTIATLVYSVVGNYSSSLAGAIVTLRKRDDINSLEDIKNKKIVTMGDGFFGAYQVPLYEFFKKDIKLNKENFVISKSHEDFIEILKSGKADVGFTRSGVIERLIKQNKISADELKYINEYKFEGFPYKASTPLYPEMAVCAMEGVDINIIREVASALYTIKEDHSVSKSLRIGGFVPPADYTVIDKLAKDLRLPPYDVPNKISVIDIWHNYQFPILVAFVVLAVIIALMIYVQVTNNRLKETQNMYLEEKNRLSAIIEFIPDLLWLKDPDGVYVICNKKFEGLYGTPQKDIIGKTDYDFVSKDLADFFRDNDNRAMYANHPCTNLEELTFSDGHSEFTETTKTFVRDYHGNLIGVLGIGRDITKLKKQEEALIEQKKELQEIFNTTKDGIAIIDKDSRFVKVNRAYCEITGLSEEELLQTSCIELSADEDKVKSKEALARVLTGETIDGFENTCVIKDRVITVNMSVALMPNGQYILISMKDISYLKTIERQSKLASMGEMIGNIAHQWRQPLSIISVIASGLKMRQDFGEFSGYDLKADMDEIVNQANYLSKTIDDFRNFIKDNSHSKVKRSLGNIMDKTLSLLNSSFKNHTIAVQLNIVDDLSIECYENELIQAFINIINNAKDAIKEHVEEDDRVIIITLVKNKEKAKISILDNGGGIPEDIIPRLYEPYFTTKHQSVGTGLGLPMAYQIIVQRHGGDIKVQNKTFEYNGKLFTGAKFTILLDLNKEESI